MMCKKTRFFSEKQFPRAKTALHQMQKFPGNSQMSSKFLNENILETFESEVKDFVSIGVSFYLCFFQIQPQVNMCRCCLSLNIALSWLGF